MILYLDSSAIVKQYVLEPGASEVQAAVHAAKAIGTAVLSRAEVAAAFRKTVRTGRLSEKAGKAAMRSFNRNWPELIRIRITERLARHAATLAWTHDLRGYDSIHLASAAAWQQALGRAVTMATFDSNLW